MSRDRLPQVCSPSLVLTRLTLHLLDSMTPDPAPAQVDGLRQLSLARHPVTPGVSDCPNKVRQTSYTAALSVRYFQAAFVLG